MPVCHLKLHSAGRVTTFFKKKLVANFLREGQGPTAWPRPLGDRQTTDGCNELNLTERPTSKSLRVRAGSLLRIIKQDLQREIPPIRDSQVVSHRSISRPSPLYKPPIPFTKKMTVTASPGWKVELSNKCILAGPPRPGVLQCSFPVGTSLGTDSGRRGRFFAEWRIG